MGAALARPAALRPAALWFDARARRMRAADREPSHDVDPADRGLVLLPGVEPSTLVRAPRLVLCDPGGDQLGRQDDRLSAVALDLLPLAVEQGHIAASLLEELSRAAARSRAIWSTDDVALLRLRGYVVGRHEALALLSGSWNRDPPRCRRYDVYTGKLANTPVF
jgi:hypothetical protein